MATLLVRGTTPEPRFESPLLRVGVSGSRPPQCFPCRPVEQHKTCHSGHTACSQGPSGSHGLTPGTYSY